MIPARYHQEPRCPGGHMERGVVRVVGEFATFQFEEGC
jgi:hypothetical protein